MGRRLFENPALMSGWLHWTKILAVAAFIAALAAMAIPGPAGDVTGIASVLAVGAIALMAQHAWGLLIVGVADLALVGKVWPVVVFTSHPDWSTATATLALITALPGLVVFVATLSRTVELVTGGSASRHHRAAMALSGTAAIAWLLMPAFSS